MKLLDLEAKIAQELYDTIFPILQNNSKTSIFLIGAYSRDKNSVRYKLRSELSKHSFFRNRYEIFYPEEVFSELLYDKSIDLLTLENLLANSVNIIIICAESWGSVAELGAFANHEILNKKLVVIVDEKHKKADSFIRKGPVRYMESMAKKDNSASMVIWHGFANGKIEELANKVQKHLQRVRKTEALTINKTLTNPVILQNFLLLLLFVVGDAREKNFPNLLRNIEPMLDSTQGPVYKAALGSLFKNRDVSLNQGKYRLSKSGIARLWNTIPLRTQASVCKVLDRMRVEVINHEMRFR
jgi:hypothetical protein